MSDAGLLELTAWQVRALYRRGELAPTTYTEFCLERIERLQPSLNAFIAVTADAALAAARAAEDELARGAEPGPLAGLPVAVKDDVYVGGVPATAGSAVFADFVPDHDATAVALLRAAGAGIVGKTNLPEFAGNSRCWNPRWGDTRNPYDPSRVSGSSSGGSAVAVATAMAALAIGSDGGGSVRIPAAHNGIVGLLPTRGIVSNYGTYWSATSSLGPMGRCVRDVALLLDVIAACDPLDPTGAAARPQGPFEASVDDGVAGLRVAWTPDFGHYPVQDPRLVELARRAALTLEGRGARVDQPGLRLGYDFATLAAIHRGARFDERPGPTPPLQTAEFAERLLDFDAQLSPDYQQRGRQATAISEADYRSARAELDAIRERWAAALDRYDVIVSPTMREYAPAIPPGWVGDVYAAQDKGTGYLAIVNLTGSCGITVPCGYVDGMPAGVHVFGRPHAERTLLRVAQAIESALAGSVRPAAQQMRQALGSRTGAG